MFQFPRFPPMRYGFTHGCIGSSYAGLPIQRSSARWSCAPPRGLSQLITSFIGSQCQGIRPAPFLFDRPCPPVASGGRLAFPAAGWSPAARLFLLLDVFPISHSRSLPIHRMDMESAQDIYRICSFQGTLLAVLSSAIQMHGPPCTWIAGGHPSLSLSFILAATCSPTRLRSTIGRPGLDLRVRYGYGYVPRAHRHQEYMSL